MSDEEIEIQGKLYRFPLDAQAVVAIAGTAESQCRSRSAPGSTERLRPPRPRDAPVLALG